MSRHRAPRRADTACDRPVARPPRPRSCVQRATRPPWPRLHTGRAGCAWRGPVSYLGARQAARVGQQPGLPGSGPPVQPPLPPIRHVITGRQPVQPLRRLCVRTDVYRHFWHACPGSEPGVRRYRFRPHCAATSAVTHICRETAGQTHTEEGVPEMAYLCVGVSIRARGLGSHSWHASSDAAEPVPPPSCPLRQCPAVRLAALVLRPHHDVMGMQVFQGAERGAARVPGRRRDGRGVLSR